MKPAACRQKSIAFAAEPDTDSPAAARAGRPTISINQVLRHRRIEPVEIYLPIADLPVNVFLVLAMGLAVGFISGMFGIGGGFLMTPLLIFVGISPAVAVATVTSHIAASSSSGAVAYWRRRALDLALALWLLAGGLVGTVSGVWLFTTLRKLGQLDVTIGVSYLLLLGSVGAMMVNESVRAILRAHQGEPPALRRPGSHTWIHGLPLKVRFKQSRIYVSAIPVCTIGFRETPKGDAAMPGRLVSPTVTR